MKKSAELLGLSVFSIEEGKEAGTIIDLIINPGKGTVEYLIVSNGTRYIGLKVIPFKNIEGVGEHAVTINNTSLVIDFKDAPDINDLLEKDVQIKGTKVITQKGKIIGSVKEYVVDDENDGKIHGCILDPINSTKPGIIPAENVVTFGKDVLVVQHNVEDGILDSLPNVQIDNNEPPHKNEFVAEVAVTKETVITKPVERIPANTPGVTPAEVTPGVINEEPVKLFEDKQRQYLVGKKTNKTIVSDDGETIIKEGTILTQDLVDKVTKAGKLLDLIMNTK